MKPIFLYSLILSITFLACQPLVSQEQKYTIDNNRAIKFYEEGLQYFDRMQLDEAENLFLKALKKEEEFVEAHTMLGYIYLRRANTDKAIQSFKNAIEINPSFYPKTMKALGEMLFQKGKYKEARKYFRDFVDMSPGQSKAKIDARKNILKCDFALKAIENPVPFNPKNLGENINSKYDEYFPSLTADDQTLLYTRALPSKKTPTGMNEDFYMSHKSNKQWQKSYNVGRSINTIMNEGAPSLGADGNNLIFAACELYGEYGPSRQGYGSCDLFFTSRVGSKWKKPANLGKPLNSWHWETQPSFSSDGKTLYFIRGKKTKQGIKDQDIYISKLGDDGRFGVPEKLSNVVNTSGKEESVMIHPDGKTLYFSSDGHLGMGGLDIFMTQKDEEGNWSKPVNLGYPINTHNDENSLLVSADGKLAYFSSDREGGIGGLDLYSFELPEHLKPNPVTYAKGKVFDAETKEPLGATFELIDLETGKVSVRSQSNSGNGEFLITLPAGKEYALNVSKKGYLFYSENFALEEEKKARNPYQLKVPLQPVKAGEKVVLRNVFFETAKYNLKPKSKTELNKLISFLENNPGIKVEIGGHTDNVGSDENNQKLSENRAKAVYTFLIENGIEKDRLSYKGYGETDPIESNETKEGRAKNRRTEFKIIE